MCVIVDPAVDGVGVDDGQAFDDGLPSIRVHHTTVVHHHHTGDDPIRAIHLAVWSHIVGVISHRLHRVLRAH